MPNTAEVPVRDDIDIANMIQGAMVVNKSMGGIWDSGYGCAQRMGLLDISGGDRNVFGARVGSSYKVRVTAKGEAAGVVLNKKHMGYPQVFSAVRYSLVASKVMGIKSLGDTEAEVLFEILTGEITEFGRCVHPNIDAVKSQMSSKARAKLGLYDHGWRVETV